MAVIDPYWISQLFVMVKKNLTLKRRNKRETVTEILYPLYWLLILYIYKTALPIDPSISQTTFPAEPLIAYNLKCAHISGELEAKRCEIGYSPSNSTVINSTMVMNYNLSIGYIFNIG